MTKTIVAVEDRMTEFMQPRAVQSVEAAERDFKVLCEDSPIAKDMNLWRIGEFNTETGEITPCKPELIMKGESYVVKDKG